MSSPVIFPRTTVLTYVFKEGSPKIQVLLNYLKNKNTGALVNVFRDNNGYTTITSTSTEQFNASADGCDTQTPLGGLVNPDCF